MPRIRLRLRETLILVAYAALIGAALVASFVTPSGPAAVQEAPMRHYPDVKMGSPEPPFAEQRATVDRDGNVTVIVEEVRDE